MTQQHPVNELTPGPLDQFLNNRMRDGNIRSPALVVTLFGDVVTQHGGEIWLGSVIHALAPLGISGRLTRTAVFRLVQDDWLTSRKQGRRSYYRLSETGQHYYQRSAIRIYASETPHWDGQWTLVFASRVPRERRDVLRKGLLWLGYGMLAPGVFALPGGDRQALNELVTDLNLESFVVQMQANAEETSDPDNLKRLVMERWDLEDLRQRFAAFTRVYRAALDMVENNGKHGDHSLFLLRLLLIHEYGTARHHDASPLGGYCRAVAYQGPVSSNCPTIHTLGQSRVDRSVRGAQGRFADT